ncbi:MAG: sulfatase-like hydrolase/transferase [Deltaproteobacteria bacterium]|nr:sulfatase-like hydrolase/transferase [Deltaproteobacteria bacterium]
MDELGFCDIDHRGLLLDFGTEALAGRSGHPWGGAAAVVASVHDGASWARVYERKLDLRVLLPAEGRVFVAARAAARGAREADVSLDGSPLGRLSLGSGEIRTSATAPTRLPVDAGLHHLKIRFAGRGRAPEEPYAEIDWVRIAPPDEIERTYGAPTLVSLLAPGAQLAGVPHRALGLRAPASIRCTLRIPAGARLRAAVGMHGSGAGSTAFGVREDGAGAVELMRVDVSGGEHASWTDIDVPLEAYSGRIVAIELSAVRTTGTGQLLLGDPVVVVPVPEPVATPRARKVVIVVWGGVERADLPPWRGTETPHLPALAELARSAVVFDEHRAPATLVASVLGALLGGRPPRAVGVADPGARLPAKVLTLGAVAHQASVRTGMFTAVPTTSSAFGFAAPWDKFVQYSPAAMQPASAPIEEATRWLTEPATPSPVLAVIHARGGHPPWELTPPEADKLPPANYSGYLSPRRSAQVLADVRARRGRLSDADRERLDAMFHVALSREDAALGRLVEALEESGVWDQTLLVVTGDVSSARATLFQDGGALDEDLLSLPLYVRFPGGALGPRRVALPTEVYDIARTALVALGLAVPPGMLGRDLGAIASGQLDDALELRVAARDDAYSARWDRWALVGPADGEPRLCDLGLDPTCAVDRSPFFPIVTESLLRRLAAFQVQTGTGAPERESAIIDAETAATLKIWGAYE